MTELQLMPGAKKGILEVPLWLCASGLYTSLSVIYLKVQPCGTYALHQLG